MALRARKPAWFAAALGGGLLLACLAWWFAATRPPQEESAAGRSSKVPGAGPRRPGRGVERRDSAPAAAVASESLTAPDPAWDNDTVSLWRTLLDVTQESIVREAAALKLASRGDRQILDRLGELWRQGLLPAGCSWVRDLMAAAGDVGGAAAPVRPGIPAAEVSRAAARATNAALPLEARVEAVRRLAVAQTDEAMAILEGLCAGDFQAPGELRVAAFEALLQSDDQVALAVLGQLVSGGTAVPANDLLAMLQALADEPHPGARDVALPLLQNADAEVREEAAWLLALNADDVTPEDVQAVLSALSKEEDAAVRRRLYSALGEAASPYAESIVAAIRTEEALSVRLSGYQAIAGMAGAQEAGPVDGLFDGQVVAELEETALSAPEYQYRFEAVVALKTARTAGAMAALARIAAAASDARIAQAAAVP